MERHRAFSILQTILSAVRRGGFRLAADPSGRFTYEPPTRYTVTERERAEQPRHDAEPPSARGAVSRLAHRGPLSTRWGPKGDTHTAGDAGRRGSS